MGDIHQNIQWTEGILGKQFKYIRLAPGLRAKMGFVLVTVLLVSLGLSGWTTLQEQEEQVLNETRQRGSDLARFTAHSVVYGVVGYDYHAIQLLLDELVKSQNINYAKVTNNKGNTMAKAGRLVPGNDLWTFFEQEIIFDETPVGKLNLQLDNSRIVQQLSEQRDELILRETILILLIAIGEFLALSFFIIRPVSIISDSIRTSVNEDGLITQDIPYHGRDELGILSAHFNNMRHRLNDTNEQLRSNVALANQKVQEKNKRLQFQSDELKLINKKLEQLSITDPLTELFNRRHFDVLLEKELSFANRHMEDMSLIIFDLDHFKSINDKYGHSVGDTTLCAVADILRKNIRNSDIACRIGGEEFAVICRNADLHEIRVISEKLRSLFHNHVIRTEQGELSVTASFGLMTMMSSPDQAMSPNDFFHCADIAMYHSKQNGRNRVTHYSDILVDIPATST